MKASRATPDGGRRVLIVEPDADGHHSFWLVLIILAFRRAGWWAVVLGPEDDARVRAQAVLHGLDWESVERVATEDRPRAKGEWARESLRLAEQVGAERVFFAFLDKLWEGLAALPDSLLTTWAGRVSGVWFHPYALDAVWRWAPPVGARWRLRGRLHRWLRAERGGAFLGAGIWFPVEEAAAALRCVNPAIPAMCLRDPWERAPRLGREEARRLLGVPTGRTVFLHLGGTEPRKGLPDVLAAFERLTDGRTATEAGAPLLLRVGSNRRLGAPDAARLKSLVEGGWAKVVDDFVPAELLMEYFSASDWVLIPYRKFRYSSGVLSNALGAERPVIASAHGEIGRVVRVEKLGLTFAHGSPAGLARALARAWELHAGTPGGGFADALARGRSAREPDGFVAELARVFARHAAPV